MAYKNQKKNKAHIMKLKKDSNSWRNIKKRRNRKTKNDKPMSLLEMEEIIKRL